MRVLATLADGQMQDHSAMRLSRFDHALETVGYEDLGVVPSNAASLP